MNRNFGVCPHVTAIVMKNCTYAITVNGNSSASQILSAVNFMFAYGIRLPIRNANNLLEKYFCRHSKKVKKRKEKRLMKMQFGILFLFLESL